MRKLIVGTILASVLSIGLYAKASASEIDYREGKVSNLCIETAQYKNDTWVKYSERKLKAGKLYKLEKFSPYKIVLGGVEFRFNEKIDNELEVYTGNLESGSVVELLTSNKNRSVLIIKIQDETPKKIVCVPKED